MAQNYETAFKEVLRLTLLSCRSIKHLYEGDQKPNISERHDL